VRLFLTLALLACLGTSAALACEGGTPCDKCAKEPEFTWNPANQHVTPRLNRFYSLEDKIKGAYDAHDDAEVKTLTAEYLTLASSYRCNWNYGNAIHDGNLYLGLVSLRNGNVDEAATFLALAGKSTGSPQLDSFGPDLDLANQVLKAGKTGPVKEYLRGVKTFWKMDDGQLDEWLSAIDRGETPELDSFAAMKPGPWIVALTFFLAVWPAIAALSFLYAGRKRLSRKWVFLVVGVMSGYASLALLNWGTVTLLPSIAGSIASPGALLTFSVVVMPVILALAAPALVVLLVYRYFSVGK